MKEKQIFIGIDVSKKTVDVCEITGLKKDQRSLKNDQKVIQGFFKRVLVRNPEYKVLVCLESTGYYNWPIYEALQSLNVTLFVVNPLHFKRSLGLIRGKSDRIDAERLAEFIKTHHSNMKPTSIPRRVLRILQALVAQRSRLVSIKSQLTVPAMELASIVGKTSAKIVLQSSSKITRSIDLQIKAVEKHIENLIGGDQELSTKFKYITSVQGVGKVLAWSMLIKTNEFKSLNDPRKIACYAGVVPFEHQSGTSINWKPRVSCMADKGLKKLLHMAAMRAIQLPGDVKTYYERKVAEGKNRMAVLNAVRNKIIARICAVVKNERIYVKSLELS